MNLVSYRRVSTKRQGDSNLGLLAQQDAINAYALKNQGTILYDFVEIETGTRRKERPIVKEAISYAKKHNATLVISKLDRLTRSVSFLSQLMDANIDFVALDFPKADRTVLQLMMVIAEFEADRIKERVNAALGQLKKKGVQLGPKNRKLTAADSLPYRQELNAKKQKVAHEFADKIYPTIEFYRSQGKTHAQIATEMNAKGYETPSGNGKWYTTTVTRTFKRMRST